LTVEFADGGSCKVHSHFDGKGGPTRKIGPFACAGGAPVMPRTHICAALMRYVAGCGISLLLLLACPLFQGQAVAGCTLVGPTMTFGKINIFSSATTSGNATFKCTTGTQAQTFYACLAIGTGSGGTTPSNRTLASGSNKISIQITGGASWPAQIGDGTSFPMEGVVIFSVPARSSGTYTFPIVRHRLELIRRSSQAMISRSIRTRPRHRRAQRSSAGIIRNTTAGLFQSRAPS
jgi:hypothetical protein